MYVVQLSTSKTCNTKPISMVSLASQLLRFVRFESSVRRFAFTKSTGADYSRSLLLIRRPHKGRCSEPRRAPKCNQGRPLRDVGPAGPARSPVGHGHVINQACNMRMSTCAGLEAAVTSPRFTGLPVLVRVSRVNGLPDSRRRDL